MDRVGLNNFNTYLFSGAVHLITLSPCYISSIYSYILIALTFFMHRLCTILSLHNSLMGLASWLFCCPCTPKAQINYVSTMKQGFDLRSEAECQWNSAGEKKKEYSSKSWKCNFLRLLGWTFQLITHKSLTLTAPIHRHRCLGRGQRKQRRLTNKQCVKKNIYIKDRKLSFHTAAELRRQWRLISWFFQRRQCEQPRWCSPLISAGRGAPRRAAAAPEPQVSPWWVGFILLSPSQ